MTHSVFCGGGAKALSDTDVILDTGANCGVVHNIHILQNVKFCPPVTFDGLAGTLTTSRKGSLGGICDAYFHPRAGANILSLSAAKSRGHTVSYYNENDCFHLLHGVTTCTFNRRRNGLYACDFANKTVIVSTVAENESHYSKREIQQARAARDLQRRLGSPPDIKLSKAIAEGAIQGADVLPMDELLKYMVLA